MRIRPLVQIVVTTAVSAFVIGLGCATHRPQAGAPAVGATLGCPCPPTPSPYRHEPKIAAVPEPPVPPPGPPLAIAAPDCRVGSTNRRCGRERWCQKTLADDLADEVSFTPVPTTIKELNKLPEHCEDNGDLDLPRRLGPERTVYEVEGIIDLVKTEKDRDYHIVLLDPEDKEWHMVVEVVDPRCPGAKMSDNKPLLDAAHEAFDDALGEGGLDSLHDTRVRVRGVGFYDRWHGQTGMAENCLELHPIVHFEVIE